ncbi:MAG: RNA polymerase sigma factor RpoD/SigA [Armatimonadota bacterium]
MSTAESVHNVTAGNPPVRAWGRGPASASVRPARSTREEEAALVLAARRGDRRAMERLISAHLRLIHQIARRYRCRSYTQEDLVQEGVLGLLAAVDRFDEQRGYRLSTYALFWIRQAIARAVEQNDRIIHLPLQVSADLRRLSRLADDRQQTLGRAPNPEELAQATGIDPRRLTQVRSAPDDAVSFEALLGADQDTSLLDLTEDPDAVNPETWALRDADQQRLQAMVQALPAREREILVQRYGLGGAPAVTLEQLSQRMRISRERVRQLEVRALSRLRQAARTGDLYDWAA